MDTHPTLNPAARRALDTARCRRPRSCSRGDALSTCCTCASAGPPEYRIVLARPHDLLLIPAIELAAARLLTGYAPASVLGETTTQFALRAARREGRLWVALADDVPVGFAHVVVREPGVAHLEEVDVHPRHGRRGVGRRLVTTVCTWAADRGFGAVSLTTFRDAPWNMPFYARLGFEVVPPGDLGPALQSVVEDESRRGLDPTQRVVMRRRSSTATDRNGALCKGTPHS